MADCISFFFPIFLMTVHSNAGGRLLLELNRLLRPGGYFVWSATPVYQNKDEDVGIWKGER